MITIFAPSASSSSPAATRVTWSVAPPAAQGTMMLIGLDGFHCACAENAAASAASATSNLHSCMAFLPVYLFCQITQYQLGHGPRTLRLGARAQDVAREDSRHRTPAAHLRKAPPG